MPFPTRACALVSAAALAAAALAVSPVASSSGAPHRHASHPHSGMHSAQVVLDWERISFRTVYTDGLTAVPVGVPVLGFTSVAMYRATLNSSHQHRSSEPAAV